MLLALALIAQVTNPGAITFKGSGTGATTRLLSNKLSDVVSVKDFGAKGDGVTDDTAAIQAAITYLGGASGAILVPSGTYKLSSAITCPGTSFTVSQRLVGLSNGDTGGSTLLFTGATNGINNCELADINIQTNNAGALIGVYQSGLHQELRNVHISTTGAGLWAKGVQQFGSVTNSVVYPVFETSCCTVALDVVPNGANQVGALTIIGGEFRSATNGTCIHLNNVLSSTMVGGSVEGCGWGITADTAASDFSQYGTHFETNSLGDVQWLVGGTYTQSDAQFPGGSPANFSCPNTTCTALVKISGAHGATSATWTFGNSISAGSSIGQSIVAGAASFTNSAAGRLSISQVSTRDGTVINNQVGYSGGNSVSRLDLVPNSGGSAFTIQSDNAGTASLTNNGTTFLRSTGDGRLRADNGIAVSGTIGGGSITLVAGTGTATVFSGCRPICTDTTAANAVKCNVATTTLTATGTGTDVINYLCF